MVEHDTLRHLKTAPTDPDTGAVVHGTAVSCEGRGVLFVGPSGAGKSSAALVLLGLGAELVADDRTELRLIDDRILLSAPRTLPALIEARGVGLLPAQMAPPVPLTLIVDMAQRETNRLPKRQHVTVFGQEVVLLNATDSVHFPYAVIQFVKGLQSPVCDA